VWTFDQLYNEPKPLIEHWIASYRTLHKWDFRMKRIFRENEISQRIAETPKIQILKDKFNLWSPLHFEPFLWTCEYEGISANKEFNIFRFCHRNLLHTSRNNFSLFTNPVMKVWRRICSVRMPLSPNLAATKQKYWRSDPRPDNISRNDPRLSFYYWQHQIFYIL